MRLWQWFSEHYKICHAKYNQYQSIKMGSGQAVSISWSSLVRTYAAMVAGCFPFEAHVERKDS
jgi:hypothetical protein